MSHNSITSLNELMDWYKIGALSYSSVDCQISNIGHTLASYKIVDHSDVVGASPAGAAPTTSSFST